MSCGCQTKPQPHTDLHYSEPRSKMEELHKVARAYYDNGSPEIRSLVHGLFYSIDTNGDNWISMAEAQDFLIREGYNNQYINSFLFNELDRDRNGVLDFNEFLALYYVIKTQNGFCSQCWRCLKGLYFTCVTCFDCPAARTFDICADCYSIDNRTTYHPHMNFVDNALLLRARRSTASNAHTYITSSSHAVEQIIQPVRNNCEIESHKAEWGRTRTAFRALEIALAAGAIGVAAFCSIM